MPEPVPADFTADLAALEHRQALLHAALAAFQAGIPQPQPLGFYGLALYHRVAVVNNAHSIEAVLVHSAGGEIASGFLPLGEPHEILGLQKMTAEMLFQRPWPYGLFLSNSQQTQSPIQWPVPGEARGPIKRPQPATTAGPEPESPAAAVEPEPEPAPAPETEPASHEAAPDEPPTQEALAILKVSIDSLHTRRPKALEQLIENFREVFQVGPKSKTPFAKALTTRARVDWLREQIDPILADIADFEQNVKAGVAESIAQGAA